MQETRVWFLGLEDSLERKWQPLRVLLPGKFHGWRSLVGYSPWGHKESDTTERLHFTFCVLRCLSLVSQMVKNLPAMQETWVQSLGREDPLEKEMATHSSILAWRIPMDGGAWWATVHGVAKSQTWLSDFTSLCPQIKTVFEWICTHYVVSLYTRTFFSFFFFFHLTTQQMSLSSSTRDWTHTPWIENMES